MADYYVSPTGTSGGTGDIGDPWDIVTAIQSGGNPGGTIQAGDTVHFRGGTYQPDQDLTCTESGTSGSPITYRSYQDETPVLDFLSSDANIHYLFVNGDYTIWRGFELMNSSTASRVGDQWGPDRGSIQIAGDNNKVINNVMHDCGVGVRFWGLGGECYGNICYNNGWERADGSPHGHGIYVQNAAAIQKTVKHNIFAANFSYGYHCYREAAANYSIDAIENLLTGQNNQLVIGGEAPAEDCNAIGNHSFGYGFFLSLEAAVLGVANTSGVYTDNFVYESEVRFGWDYTGSLEFQRNTIYWNDVGQKLMRCVEDMGATAQPRTWDNNDYHSPSSVAWVNNGISKTFGQWQSETGFDANATWESSAAPSDTDAVFPNEYDSNRAHAVIHNWTSADNYDLYPGGWISNGESYEVYHVYDLTTPVASGTYSGVITIPMAAKSAPDTIGAQNRTPPVMPKEYGIFLLKKTPSASPGNDFSGDPSCVCLWRMEDGALTEDSQGTNTLTNEGNNVVPNTIDFKEGAASGEFDAAVNSRMRINDAALDSGFPYKSGETTRDMSVCFWVRLDAVHDSGNYGLVEKFDIPSARSFDIEEESRTIRVLTGYNNGTQHETNVHGGTLVAGQWYHVAYTFKHIDASEGNNRYRIRIWDDTAGAILQSPGAEPETDKVGNLISEISITAADIYLMNYALTNYSDGALDEVVWFNRPISVEEIDAIRQGNYGATVTAPTYAPDQCWAEALNAGACEVWWSNVNSTDNCRVRIERATSPDGPWTFVANANQTIDPVTYAVEVTAATATEATLKRVNDGDFDHDWFFSGALIAVEAGGTMTPGARFRVNSIAGDFKTIKVATSESIGNTGMIARIDWMGLTTQDSYTDTSVPADTVLYYRLRTEASDGSDPTVYAHTPHFIKTPPDDQTPVIAETFDDSMPSLSGTVHRPVNGAQLKALLQPASGLSRGDVIELQNPTWFEGQVTFQASDSSVNRSSGSWFMDGFTVGQLITIEGSTSNNGLHTIQTVSASKLTLTASSQAISDETVTIQLWYTTYQTDWYYWQDLGALSGDRNLDYVIIRGEDHDQLPPSGYRIDEASRRYMPIVRSPNSTTPAFLGRNTVNGAFEPGSYYYVHGIRFVRPAVNATVTQPPLVRLDSDQTEDDNAIEYDDIGHHFIFDQCWFDGLYYNPDYDCIRGLIANANYVSVKNCWFQGFTRAGQDGQCILVNMSFGPLRIVNNTIYGDGIAETIMLGGGGNRIAGAGAAHVTMHSNRFDCHPEFDRRDPKFNFQPASARTSWLVEVVSSDSDTTRLKMADDSQFPSSLYPRDRIRIETGGGITAGTYEVVDRSSNGASTNILIDAPSETPGQQATLMRCTGYTKKNTFEIKNGNTVDFRGNILRRCPVSAQRGYPFVLTPKSHGLGRGPGGTVRYFHWAKAAWDFQFHYNWIENHDGDCVIQLSVQPEAGVPGINTMSALGRRVLVEHNLYSDHSRDGHAGLFQVSVGTGENKKDFNAFITRHNTTQVRPPDVRRIWQTNHCRQGTSALASDTERPFIITGQWRANIIACGIDSYTCLSGTNLTTAEAVRTGLTDTNNYEWQDNLWIDSDNSVPQGDIPAADLSNAADYDAVGWKDWQNGDFELDAGSPYKGAATPIEPGGFDDPGVDFVTLQTYLETVETGQPEVPPVTSVFIGSRTEPPRLQGRSDSNRIT